MRYSAGWGAAGTASGCGLWVRARRQRVGGRHDEQREQRAERQAADDHPADRLPASAPAPLASASGTAPSTIAPVVIRIGRRRSAAASITASQLAPALLAQLVGELDDQDAVLGDQADQHDQADLAVDVERAAGELERQQRAGHRQRHGEHDDERIDEALELRREHQIDEDQRQHEGDVEAAAGSAELAPLAGRGR